MTSEIDLVIRLQDIDQRIAELQKEIATLPKRVASIEKALEQHQRRLEVDRAALAANLRERKKCEGEIQLQEQKISKLRDQLLIAKTNDQYKAFQSEITFCEVQTKKYEDRILELMSESEPFDKAVKAAEERLKAEKASVDREKKNAELRTAEDKKQLAKVTAEHESVAAGVKPQVLKEYKRILKKHSGAAIADATDGRCDGCNMMLRPQFYQELKLSNGQVIHCESCGRILTYNPPVVVDEQDGPISSASSTV